MLMIVKLQSATLSKTPFAHLALLYHFCIYNSIFVPFIQYQNHHFKNFSTVLNRQEMHLEGYKSD